MLKSDRRVNAITRAADAIALSRVLSAIGFLLLLIVIVGGMTRLSGAGLSITEWKPVTGIIPPLSGAQWEFEFEAYRGIPQFKHVTGPAGMTLADYKVIYFWEWAHRLLARLIGLAFLLPIGWLWMRGRIPAGYRPRLAALVLLVAIQGIVGWWMVTSGLTQDVKVSHLRLAIHLALALVTLGCVVWTALDLNASACGAPAARLAPFAWIVLAALFFQMLLGAMVAGLQAGYVAGAGWGNLEAWPQMQGSLVPRGIDWSRGLAFAGLNDPYLIHFVHRWWALALLLMLAVTARILFVRNRRRAAFAIGGLAGAQVVLGVTTIWSGMSIWLAAGHQFLGAVLLCATTYGLHIIGRR